MAITVKKSVKTIKAKPQTKAKGVGTPEEEARAAALAAEDLLADPEPVIGPGGKVGTSPKLAAIFAIITFLLFAALITLQVLEWKYFEATPSVWPRKILSSAAPTSSVTDDEALDDEKMLDEEETDAKVEEAADAKVEEATDAEAKEEPKKEAEEDEDFDI